MFSHKGDWRQGPQSWPAGLQQKVKASTASKKPTPKQKPTTNTLCVMCRDGADLLWGFYSQGQPVLARPPLIQGTFQHAISGQVASLPTALVHLHLDNLELGHPQPYFSEKSYLFSHLPFNLATEQSLVNYEKAAMDLTHSLSSFSRVVIFLTTHRDEERGDLFAGHLDGKPVAFKVSEVLFNDLKEADHKSMILFDAQHLQLASTTPYLLSLLDSTIIEGFDVFQAAKFALNDCALLGRHSNIIIIMWKSEGQGVHRVEKVVAEKFLWTDKFIRPWGEHLPVQCPQCGTMQKWE
ncbi:hypothetical protein EDD17DRAFT_1506010 [Pisolithus thermaeus]|nr:hypothetical protein EDD17DRAFT_1506010 [Pisolithus thermaeus]